MTSLVATVGDNKAVLSEFLFLKGLDSPPGIIFVDLLAHLDVVQMVRLDRKVTVPTQMSKLI